MTINDTLPKSRVTLTYRTAVSGQKQDVELPFRLLVMGDLSLGTSVDRKVGFDERRIRNLDGGNLNSVIKDMDLSLDINVPNRVDNTGGDIQHTLKFDGMGAFEPAAIAEQIPKLKALALMKRLLLEVQADLDNRKEFRKKIRQLAKKQDAVQPVLDELEKFEFASFRLARPSTEADGAGTETAATEPEATEPEATEPAPEPET